MSRFALVIGNSEYLDPKLARLVTPVEDVDGLAQVLSAADIGGFDDVRVLIDKSMLEVRRVIARFFAGKKPDDLLLLFFSGHGVRDERGLLYLAVQDTEHDLLNATAIPAAFITDEMDQSRSRRQVLILDCCHSGAFAHGAKAAADVGVGTAAAFAGTGFGRMVLTATDATQFAWEGDQVIGQADKSVFTHFLVEGLRTGQADTDADGQITLDELYDYVYERVVKTTSKQTPRKFTYNQQGDVVIAHNPRPIVKPAPLPPELRQAIENPLSGIREGAVRELERLLSGHHRGLSLAAFEALQALVQDDSRRVSLAAEAALATRPEGPLPNEGTAGGPLSHEPAEHKPSPHEAARVPVEPPAQARRPDEAAPQQGIVATPEPARPVVADTPHPAPVSARLSERQPLGDAHPSQGRLGATPTEPRHEALTPLPLLAKEQAGDQLNTVWLAFLLAVGGHVLGSAAYGAIIDAGQPTWVADLLDSGLSGLAVCLVLWMRSRLRWAGLLALAVIWTLAGVLGGANIDRLRDNTTPLAAWISGLALIGAVRGAATATLLARRHRKMADLPGLAAVAAGWVVATVLPPLVISGTPYWVSPTTGSGLLWGLLEGVVGIGVLLWQVQQLGTAAARLVDAADRGALRSRDWGSILFAAVGWPVAFGLVGGLARSYLERASFDGPFIAGLVAGALAGLIVSLPLRQAGSPAGARMGTLMAAWAAAWGVGAWLMVRLPLQTGQALAGLWLGFALLVVLSSAVTGTILARHLGASILTLPALIVAAGWLLAGVFPYQMAWDLMQATAPATWLLIAAALSGAAGAGVMLWQALSIRKPQG